FNFQYDSVVPQVVQLNTITLAPEYPLVNASLRIITRCSVTSGSFNQVNIKVAKNEPPTALDSSEKSALEYYVNTIKPVGVIYNIISIDSDKFYCGATIYYKGAYSSVILSTLQTAYDNYLASIPFDGVVTLTDLEIALK